MREGSRTERERERGSEEGRKKEGAKKQVIGRRFVKPEKRIPPTPGLRPVLFLQGAFYGRKFNVRDDFPTHSETPNKSIREWRNSEFILYRSSSDGFSSFPCVSQEQYNQIFLLILSGYTRLKSLVQRQNTIAIS